MCLSLVFDRVVSVFQIFIANSAKYSDMCHPFGYLKASSALTAVNLFVMPYNYPVLLPLLGRLPALLYSLRVHVHELVKLLFSQVFILLSPLCKQDSKNINKI